MMAFTPTPSILDIMAIAAILLGIVFFCLLFVLKSLLKRTALMRTELDEVV